MSDEPLSLDDVRHVARLARLRLDDAQLEHYRIQLSAVVSHLTKIAELDLADVEPMAHPLDITNRLADDVIADPLPIEALLENAPNVEGRFLAVPKVLGEGGES
jgi:aspartyl/glutamyl-tRNA(Asn/Gln) amidotransferase C subunit